MKNERTDAHRPSAIIPTDYVFVLHYSLPIGGIGFNTAALTELRASAKFAATGGIGKCSVCGACYNHGEVWLHVPTNEHIHGG